MKRYGWIGVAAVMAGQCQAQGWNPFSPVSSKRPVRVESGAYYDAIERTANMVQDDGANRLVHAFNLDLLSLTWEDTGRYKGSSVGPNISDMTIQVAYPSAPGRGGSMEVKLMPVIRTPNFSDITGDLDPRDLTLLVGNENGSQRLERVSLADYLENATEFMTKPSSWKGRNRTLLSERDSKVLVSAQACFLPVPKSGKATFNPVIFNYQSTYQNPAVLTILATREGTSMTIIDNHRDGFGSGFTWGQRLFHNANGQRASLTGERLTDFLNKQGRRVTDTSGLNMVLLIQVPLKHREEKRQSGAAGGFGGGAAYESAKSAPANRGSKSDVEAAVIGHGDMEGPFAEVDNLAIERDPRFPVRVTVQFYQATSNGIVSRENIAQIRQSIEGVYKRTQSVGSLVTEGNTGRPTEYWGSKVQPATWWSDFWTRYERDTGRSRYDATRKLRTLLGDRYMDKPVTELYLRDCLR